MPRVKISSTFLIWAGFLIFLKSKYILPLACAVVLHELGHVLCACVLRIKIKCFSLSLLGARLEICGDISYADELLLALSGPFFGFLGFALCFYASLEEKEMAFCSEFLLPFSLISLSLTLINLLPVKTLDGGRAFSSLLHLLLPLRLADAIASFFGFVSVFFLWLFSVYCILKLSGGLAMLVFSSLLFAKLYIANEK